MADDTRIFDKTAILEAEGVTNDTLQAALETIAPSYSDDDANDAFASKVSTLDPATATVADILAAFGIVAVVPEPVNTTLPLITGTAQEGAVLTVTPGVWSNNPLPATGVWYRGSTATTRVGLTYILTSADIGQTISYLETVVSRTTGQAYTANSLATAAVIAATVAPPAIVTGSEPVVSGTNTVGSTLSVTNGTWTGSPTAYAYEWQRDGVPIGSPNVATYVLTSADLGKSVRCRVTATNAGGARGVISSNAKTIVTALAISGTVGTALVGTPFSFVPVVTGGSGTRAFALTGTLPSGFSFSTTTGAITGTATTAGTTSGLNITISDPSGSPPASLGTFALVRSASGAWGVGLSRSPSYVPTTTRPVSVAAGKGSGVIPINAIPFETGNSGSAFPDWPTWLDACNAADAAGAIETNLNVASLGKRYLKRGIYGAGATAPKITYTSRSSGHAKGGSLYVHTEDITIQDVELINFSNVLCVGYPTVRLAESGALTGGSPYFTGNDPAYVAANCGTDAVATGNGDGFHVRQIGSIIIVGSVNISAISVIRQIPATDGNGTSSSLKFLDADWYATTETVPLFTGAACTTHAQVRDAINANSSTTGFAAELKADGSVRLLPVSRNTRVADEFVVTKTGSGTVGINNRTPAVTFNRVTMTDCDNGYIGILDVLALGPVNMLGVDAPGTWNLLAAPVLRWTDLRVANCRWRDCVPSRPLAAGRASGSVTTSQLPPGSSLTARGTFIWLGNDSAAKMRYHGADGGNLVLLENNEALNVESVNNTNTVNSAVFFDIRNGWQVTANGKRIRFAYNTATHLVGTKGAEDSNWGYLKCRGYTIIANVLDGFGDGWIASTSTQDGTEAGANLTKNPQEYYRRDVTGIAAAGGGAVPEDHIIRANTFRHGPVGCTYNKFDELGSTLWFDFNLIEDWDNQKGGVANTAGPSSGCVRATGHQYGVQFNSNRFRNCNPRGADKRVMNCWNLTAVGTVDGSRWSFANNEWWNDFTAYAADTDLITYNGPTSNSFLTNVVTGFNKILSSTGVDTGFKWLIRSESGNAFPGTLTATAAPYGSIDFLQSYGFMG